MQLNNLKSSSSFHPAGPKKMPNYNIVNSPSYSLFTDNGKEPINYQNQSISSAVELALITVNLSWVKFKSMNKYELEVYVKTAAYNNSYESKKYLLALDILNTEMDKTHNNVIKQSLPLNKPQPEKSFLEKAMGNNRININETICIESDDFNLLTKPINNFSSGFLTQNNLSSGIQNDNQTQYSTNTQNSNFNPSLGITHNKNLDMATYSGNPFGTTKIINGYVGNSVKPKNYENKNVQIQQIQQTQQTQQTPPQSIMHNGRQYYLDNQSMQSMGNMQVVPNMQNNNIIQQTSFISSQSNAQFNGGRRRTSNMDVGSSNNYVVIG